MPTKILVVDNTEGISDMLNFSRTADYDVFSATNAKDALKIIGEKRPQLLVSDVNIPDMDGIEFLCHIKKHHPGTEVVMISDVDNIETGVKSLKYEASDFIVKPVTNNTLEIILERAKKRLAIRKKLNPSYHDKAPAEGPAFERLFLAKQIIARLSDSQRDDSPSVSGILSIHSPGGIVLETSPGYLNLIGTMEGKNSWEMYRGEAFSKESCPCLTAAKTKKNHFQKALLKTKENQEIEVDVFAAPLTDTQDKVDLVIEIINLP